MADTHGFAVVVEAAPAVLRKALQGAWKSAECPEDPGDIGRIPEAIDIDESDGFGFGGYVVRDGQVQIPQNELDATLAPDIDGTELKLGLHIQFEIKDPPVPSAALFNTTADVRARVPIRVPPGEKAVCIILDGLPRDNVSATLTSGDPLAPQLNQLLRDYVHLLYEANGEAFPHTVTRLDQTWSVPFGSVTIDSYAEIYDDLANPAHSITVTGPAAGTVTISIPIYLRIYNIRRSGSATLLNLLSPMGIETRIDITAPFEQPPGLLRARFAEATVTVGAIAPAGSAHGQEGPNYTANKATIAGIGLDLDALLRTELQKQGQDMATKIGTREIEVPTVAQIEDAIADYFHVELESRERISVWTPRDSPEVNFTVADVASRVHAEMLAIALNSTPGSDIGALSNFVPAGREFAIGLSAAQVGAAIDKARDDNDLEDGDLPKRLTVDDDKVDINELDVFLVAGAIRITGAVTVIDAILDSIDVDADFSSDIGLEWVDGADGQEIRDVQLGDPDIDPEESVALWVIGLIVGVLTGGLGGALIAALILLIITLIVDGIASSIGGSVVKDQVSGAVVGFGGWPEELSRIGRVRSRFENPIAIETTGLVMSGTLEVISSCESTAIAFADSGGAYAASAASALTMSAQRTHADAAYAWSPGDGGAEQTVQDLTYTYAASGLYIAKHALTMGQPGGIRSRHFAAVDVANVAPHAVDAGPDMTVKEGEVITLVGHFRDVEYPDTHETSWVFGDDQPAEPGTVAETHDPPEAAGTSTAKHAWCDNGTYTVTFTVRDQNGGFTQDTLKVTVLNVPPTVDAGQDLFAYPCTPITLTAAFEDKGWCDTHTATWDFGDCTPPHTAVVRETNQPPTAKGTAVASHTYECCGRFDARCTVADDDGAATTDSAIIQVVELLNPGFEGGFRPLEAGKVGNDWEPYAVPSRPVLLENPGLAGAGQAFGGAYDCEECIVHEGQRSQRITPRPDSRAGVLQRFGANPGWSYQVSSWAFVEEGASAWLGIDPLGGYDPLAPTIVWTRASARGLWVQLCERVVAGAKSATIFLETECEGRSTPGFHDEVTLVAVQDSCPPPPPDPRTCVDFQRLTRGEHPSPLTREGFAFTAVGATQLLVMPGGQPALMGLRLSPAGIGVEFPFAASRVLATVMHFGGKPPQLECLDASGGLVGEATANPQQSVPSTLEVTGKGMVAALVRGQEALLISICLERDGKSGQPRGDDAKDRPPTRNDPATKLDEPLRSALRAARPAAHDAVDIIISLERPANQERAGSLERAGTPGEAARASKETGTTQALFEAEARPLVDRLTALGAREIRPLWIARAVAARVPLSAVLHLASGDEVRQIALDTKRKVL